MKQAGHWDWIWFENSAHFPQWEEAEELHCVVVRRVLAQALARERGSVW